MNKTGWNWLMLLTLAVLVLAIVFAIFRFQLSKMDSHSGGFSAPMGR
jgi:hypothetical protein